MATKAYPVDLQRCPYIHMNCAKGEHVCVLRGYSWRNMRIKSEDLSLIRSSRLPLLLQANNACNHTQEAYPSLAHYALL